MAKKAFKGNKYVEKHKKLAKEGTSKKKSSIFAPDFSLITNTACSIKVMFRVEITAHKDSPG